MTVTYDKDAKAVNGVTRFPNLRKTERATIPTGSSQGATIPLRKGDDNLQIIYTEVSASDTEGNVCVQVTATTIFGTKTSKTQCAKFSTTADVVVSTK